MAPDVLGQRSPLPSGGRFFGRPSTTEGRRACWAVFCGLALVVFAALLGLAARGAAQAVFVVLGLGTIVVGGVYAIVAIARRGERSALVLGALLVWLFLVIFLIGEFASPH